MQKFIAHPSHYRPKHPLVSEDQSNTHLLPISDRGPEPTDDNEPDCHIAQSDPSSSSHYRTGSVDHDIFEREFPPKIMCLRVINWEF